MSALSSVNSSTRSFASDFKREAVSSIIAENLALNVKWLKRLVLKWT